MLNDKTIYIEKLKYLEETMNNNNDAISNIIDSNTNINIKWKTCSKEIKDQQIKNDKTINKIINEIKKYNEENTDKLLQTKCEIIQNIYKSN